MNVLFIFYALRDRGRRRMTTKEEKAKMEAAKWAVHMAKKKKAKEAQRRRKNGGQRRRKMKEVKE